MSEWVPDVSEFQGNVDMSAIKNAGAAGVIIRAGFGTLRKDRNWDQNRANAERVGLPWLAYWFNYPNYNSAHDEAAMFNSVVGPLPKGCGVAADFENDANNWPNNGYGWASEFLAKAGPTDYPTVWYSSPSFVNPHGLQGLKQPYWVAHYGVPRPAEPVPATLWQFTSSGSVSGISGRCDVSVVLRGSFRNLLYGGEVIDMTPEQETLIRDTRAVVGDIVNALKNGAFSTGGAAGPTWEANAIQMGLAAGYPSVYERLDAITKKLDAVGGNVTIDYSALAKELIAELKK